MDKRSSIIMDPNQNPQQPSSQGSPQFGPTNMQEHVSQYAVTPHMQAQTIGSDSQSPEAGAQNPANSKPSAPPPKGNPNSTQNTLQISEIRDGIVIMNDGSFRSVIMTKTINFDLMSPQEREAVEFSYQSFLNSLYFPIQIFVRSTKVDLRPYLEKLDKIRSEHDNMLLAMLMDDYLNFMDSLSQQTNIMDKKFYVVVPYTPPVNAGQAVQKSKSFFSNIFGFNKKQEVVTINEATLEDAKIKMRNQVQAVLNGLIQMGIQAIPLDTQELIELYYDVYNPDTATRQQIKNFNDLTAPVVTKGQGEAYQPNLHSGMEQ